MHLDYTQAGVIVISMESYINMVLNDAPDSMSRTATTPAASHLFKINDNLIPLSLSGKEIFVRLTMQGLYLSQCACPDIQTAISFSAVVFVILMKRTTKIWHALFNTFKQTGALLLHSAAMERDRFNGALMHHMPFMWI